jgi:hypothetical protein
VEVGEEVGAGGVEICTKETKGRDFFRHAIHCKKIFRAKKEESLSSACQSVRNTFED